jgi:uracil-DNA glycosylase
MELEGSNILNFTAKISTDWKKILEKEINSQYFSELEKFIASEIEAGKTVYPDIVNIFNAFNQTACHEIKVVIIGQDPYHGKGQAHGLCFSVQKGIAFPPSLNNIFKEINHDLHIPVPKNGDLTKWAKQGVFLLNTLLTVVEGKPKSHEGIGWEKFTSAVIEKINETISPTVFLLWGKDAKEYSRHIDEKKHFILTASHPAAEVYGGNKGFFGCRHFSKTNEILKSIGKTPIDWSLE